jgi:putative DNA methylase
MSEYRKKLIEVAMPLEAINAASAAEKNKRHAIPASFHHWWARRPLTSCRAVLFGQLVDDPSSWPKRFPTEEEQDAERQRLFGIIQELVIWENSNNQSVLNAARKEIAQSLARNRIDTDEGTERDDDVLADAATSEIIDAYLAEVAPPVHDPFAGGGAIPLEAQRLGFRAIATDLNPVAVLINKAMIEIPPKFAGKAPVHQDAEQRTNWNGVEGLAEDVRRYGGWMRDEAQKRIGHLYPEVELPEEHGGGKATVIAWLWARTVESPDPAFKGVQVPLVRSFMLSTKKGKRAWVEPVVADDRKSYKFEIRTGEGEPELEGTVNRSGGTCLVSGNAMPFEYIRSEAKAGRMGARLMAIVAEGNRKRVYLDPTEEMQSIAESANPQGVSESDLPEKALGFRVQEYGMTQHRDLFTPRQLVALTTFSDLVQEAREKAIADARAAGWEDDEKGIEDGGSGATAYGDSITTYLAFVMAKYSDLGNALCRWEPKAQCPRQLFARHAIPMVWDYSEGNPLGNSSGSWAVCLGGITKSLKACFSHCSFVPLGHAYQMDAADIGERENNPVICCDPPYYDNIGYADLSDFFYCWHRRTLKQILPKLFSTILVPKATELVASPYRHGGSDEAETFFMNGMMGVISGFCSATGDSFPTTIYYAFKQSETNAVGTSSPGWEAFLAGVLKSGYQIVSTWPSRTENATRIIAQGTNALASSIVLVCRKGGAKKSIITRGDFLRLLREKLPSAIRDLAKGNIAPVDVAQSSIGPGIGIYSKFSQVIEADGSAMSVRTALQLINDIVDEIRGKEEADFDGETRFAATWFETHGFDPGTSGDAINIATARNVSIDGIARSGVIEAVAGKTRLLKRADLPEDWDPTTDTTLTVWECTQHLIKRLEEQGEAAAADLLHKMGPRAEAARTLAYRLYTHCERTGNAEEARAYNGLVIAWPELQKLVSSGSTQQMNRVEEADLFTTGEER